MDKFLVVLTDEGFVITNFLRSEYLDSNFIQTVCYFPLNSKINEMSQQALISKLVDSCFQKPTHEVLRTPNFISKLIRGEQKYIVSSLGYTSVINFGDILMQFFDCLRGYLSRAVKHVVEEEDLIFLTPTRSYLNQFIKKFKQLSYLQVLTLQKQIYSEQFDENQFFVFNALYKNTEVDNVKNVQKRLWKEGINCYFVQRAFAWEDGFKLFEYNVQKAQFVIVQITPKQLFYTAETLIKELIFKDGEKKK